MGRNKTTGGSHNKKASTYKSKRIFKSQNKNKQPTLFKFLKYSRDVDNNEDSRQMKNLLETEQKSPFIITVIQTSIAAAMKI